MRTRCRCGRFVQKRDLDRHLLSECPTLRVCDVPGCGRPHRARGLCHSHWARWKRSGSVEEDRLLPCPRTLPVGPLLGELDGMSADDAGRLIGVTRRTIVRWRAGQVRRIGLELADRAAWAVGSHINVLWPYDEQEVA